LNGATTAGGSNARSKLDVLERALDHGTVISDPELMGPYRGDHANLVDPGEPLAVLLPGCLGEVSAALAWSHAYGVPVVARGAGTGLSGGAAALDGSIVVCLERMRQIRNVAPDDQLVEVEAGVITAEISKHVERFDLFYPPDPSSFEISTIGGNLATNAGGLRCVKYGVTRDAVLGLEVVLADGRVLHTGGKTVKNVAGYDLTRLFVGSEGTLGIITAATLRLRPRPVRGPVTFVATFATTEAAGACVSSIIRRGLTPSLLELMDHAMINAIEDYRRHDLDRSAAALLIGQADGPDAPDQLEKMCSVCDEAGATMLVASHDPTDAEALLSARRLAYFATEALGTTIIEDVGVPRSRLAELIHAIGAVAERHHIQIPIVGHAGDGNLHPTLVLARDDPNARATALEAAQEICTAALDLGGTITGEHGVGALKRAWLAGELDDVAMWAHRQVKAALDPSGIMNPGRAF
jgi:glycolate oxidase